MTYSLNNLLSNNNNILYDNKLRDFLFNEMTIDKNNAHIISLIEKKNQKKINKLEINTVCKLHMYSW